MKRILAKTLGDKRFIKYFIMACVVVSLEITLFQLLYLYWNDYKLATVVSFTIGLTLNWILSRKLVFGASDHHPAKEFTLIAIASLAGVAIQLLVIYVCVELLNIYPLLGKIISIAFSFFWNYWFRLKYVFQNR